MSTETVLWNNVYFITLTYDDEKLPEDGRLCKEDLQKFFKRYRKNLKQEIKYFACGEYGETTHRPHYHIVLFTNSVVDKQTIAEQWQFNGHVDIKPCQESGLRYVIGYTLKKLRSDDTFQVCSKGLGLQLLKDSKKIRQDGYVTYKGVKYNIPRYILDKMYLSDEELEEIKAKRSMMIATKKQDIAVYYTTEEKDNYDAKKCQQIKNHQAKTKKRTGI